MHSSRFIPKTSERGIAPFYENAAPFPKEPELHSKICSAQSHDLRNLPIGPDHQIASSGCAICRSVQITRLRRQAAQSADRSRSPDCVVRLRNLPIGPDHQIASSGCAICRSVQITRLRRQAAQSGDHGLEL